MSKDEVRQLTRKVDVMEATQRRQVDQINRLIGYRLDEDTVNPTMTPYEHELMHVNEQLALKDLRIERLEGTLRRIRQSCSDRARMPGGEHATRVLEMLEEVMPSERPDHVATGIDTTKLEISETFEYVVE